MTEILPKEVISTDNPIKYRDNDEIEFVIRAALEETGIVKRVRIDFLRTRCNVFVHSNKRSGGWRVDMSLSTYQFMPGDTLEQMKSFVKQEFMRIIRNSIDEWMSLNTDNLNKVLMIVAQDLSVDINNKLAARTGVDDGIN